MTQYVTVMNPIITPKIPNGAAGPNRLTISGPVNCPMAKPAGALVVNTPTAVARVEASNVRPMRLIEALQMIGNERPATARAANNDQYAPFAVATQLQRQAPNNPPPVITVAHRLSTRSKPIPTGMPITTPVAKKALRSQLAAVVSTCSC